jgi:hypothetical protein
MRFFVDEGTGPAAAAWLREEGYEIFSVFDSARGLDDISIVQKAFSELGQLLANHAERLPDQFVVATENTVRFAKQ